MDDDWASEGEGGQGLGDFAIPEVSVPEPPSKPAQSPSNPAPPPAPAPSPPVVNAWAPANSSGDVRLATRLRNAANLRSPAPSGAPHLDPRARAPPPVDTRRARPVPNMPQIVPSQHSVPVPPQHPIQVPPQHSMPVPSQHGAYQQGGGSAVSVLYVTHLPAEVREHDVAGFFARCGVSMPDVRIIRHSDTGNVKAAFVTVRGEANREMALGLDGIKLMGRAVYVKIDGADRRNAVPRDRGLGFGGRDRAEVAKGDGMWGERSNVPYDGGNDRREVRSKGRGRNSGEQREDPTIPTGPTPAGRKKLMLKPRTKPMPVLEVDTRAIDGVKSSGGLASSGSSTGGGDAQVEKGVGPMSSGRRSGAIGKEGGPASAEKWSTLSKEGGGQRGSVGKGPIGRNPVSKGKEWANKKEDDNKNRPVLLNAFAALEVNDTDV